MKQSDINRVKRAQEDVSKALAELDSIEWLDLTERESLDHNTAFRNLINLRDYLRMWVNELTKEE